MAKSKAKRAKSAVGTVTDNDYVKRLIEDEDLRDSVRDAFESARDAYERLSSNGSLIDTAGNDELLIERIRDGRGKGEERRYLIKKEEKRK